MYEKDGMYYIADGVVVKEGKKSESKKEVNDD